METVKRMIFRASYLRREVKPVYIYVIAINLGDAMEVARSSEDSQDRLVGVEEFEDCHLVVG